MPLPEIFQVSGGGVFVHLVGRHYYWLFEKLRRIQAQLFHEIFVVVRRVAPVGPRHVHHQHERLASLYVAQELVPQPPVVARSVDEPGNVGEPELFVTLRIFEGAYIHVKCRERVRADFGVGARY